MVANYGAGAMDHLTPSKLQLLLDHVRSAGLHRAETSLPDDFGQTQQAQPQASGMPADDAQTIAQDLLIADKSQDWHCIMPQLDPKHIPAAAAQVASSEQPAANEPANDQVDAWISGFLAARDQMSELENAVGHRLEHHFVHESDGRLMQVMSDLQFDAADILLN